MPVPRVVTTTRPRRPAAAPYRTSARPAASASLTTCTSRPVASVNRASASVPIQASSMLAAELDHPVPDDSRHRDPDGARGLGEVAQELDEDGGDRLGGRGLGGLDPDPVGREGAGLEVHRCALDARAAEVDAEGTCVAYRSSPHEGHEGSVPRRRPRRDPRKTPNPAIAPVRSPAIRATVDLPEPAEEMIPMSSFVIEEEHGTDTRPIHHHNGVLRRRLPGRPDADPAPARRPDRPAAGVVLSPLTQPGCADGRNRIPWT